MDREEKKAIRDASKRLSVEDHQGIVPQRGSILNRFRVTHRHLMDGAAYSFRPVCPLCNDAVLTVRYVLVECNSLSDVRVNCGLVNPNGDRY